MIIFTTSSVIIDYYKYGGCVDTGPSQSGCSGAYYAVNTVLVIGTDYIWSCKYNLLKSLQDAQHQMHTYSSNKSLLLW
jgi:hypothetical protein